MITKTQPTPGWTCPTCSLDGVASAHAEAALLASIHDRVLHRGAPTAQLRARTRRRRRMSRAG